MPKTTIVYEKGDGRYGDPDAIKRVIVSVDGKKVAAGNFGGEPEDNSFERDYSWVGDALEALAKALGSEVEIQ